MKLKIGHKLLAVREDRKLTQAEVADLLGIPQATYSRIERNETSVTLDKITNFAKELQVSIHELLPETVSVTNNNNHSGQGGGVIFGNQYFYVGNDVIKNSLVEENKKLQSTLTELAKKIAELEDKMKDKD